MLKPCKNALILPVLLLALTACTTTETVHGHVIKETQLNEIRMGIHDRNDVAAIMGTPSTVSTFSDSKWYYINETRVKKPLRTSTLKDRRIVIVTFDDKGRVSGISEKDGSNSKIVERNQMETPTSGQKLGAVEQVFDNLGLGF